MTWVKGQSGNPRGGKPRRLAVAPLLRSILHEREPESGETYRRCVALALVKAAVAGNVEAAKVILDRVDGPLKVPVEHSGLAPAPLPVVFDHTAFVAALVAPALALGSGDDHPPPRPPQVPGDGPPLGQDADGR